MSHGKAYILGFIALILSLILYIIFLSFTIFGTGTEFYLNHYNSIQIFYLVSQIIAAVIAITVYRNNKNVTSTLALISVTLFSIIFLLVKIMGLLMFG